MLADLELAAPDCAWVAALAHRIGVTPEASLRSLLAPPRSPFSPAQTTRVHPTTRGFTSLFLAARLASIPELPDLSPLADLVWLDVRGTHLERLDLRAARRLEVVCASDTPLASIDLPAAPSPFRWLEVHRTRLRSIDISAHPMLECLEWEGTPLEAVHACDLTARSLADLQGSPLASRITTRPATAAELHAFADHHNFDDGPALLSWIVSHPACDLGTALLAYWRCDPVHVRTGNADYERPYRDLLALVEARVAAGAYATATCPYDPVADGFGDGHMDNPTIPDTLRRKVP